MSSDSGMRHTGSLFPLGTSRASTCCTSGALILHKRSPHSANLRKRVPETPPLSLEEALGRVLVLAKRGMSSARNIIETVFRFDETIFGVEL
jgi:hypothetical protein